MFEKFQELEQKFISLEAEMSSPDVLSDINRYNDLNRKRAELEETVRVFREYRGVQKDIGGTRELLAESHDPEFTQMVAEELSALELQEKDLHQQLMILLLPVDPNDRKNAYLEIRSGTGGEEAALFARDLFEMYTRFSAKQGWVTEVVDFTSADAGGFAKVVVYITGNKVFSRLKFESGTHRVQRVPATEASGRIHTSAATVAIMPEADEVDIKINPVDLKIDTFRSSGAGGQHINKTESAIRITHVPTGLVVACQEDRSQHKNKDKAMKLLMAKLWEQQEEERLKLEHATRKMQVGSGDRSEKIRTYNYPQGRVTDHRIGLTLHKLDAVMLGDLDDIIDALIVADRMEKLQRI